jgi:hypothetical protein
MLLGAMPVVVDRLDHPGKTSLAALLRRGLAVRARDDGDNEIAVLTDAGREVIESNGSTFAEPATPARREQARETSPAETSPVRASRAPAAAALNYQELRAEIVARYEADLAALDRVIEIVARLDRLKATETNAAE